jgi:hypothetical protein
MADNATGQPDNDGTTAAAPVPGPILTESQTDRNEVGQESREDQDDVVELNEDDQWVFLIDPAWQAENEDEEPPPEAVVGGWFVDADGTTGYFRPNPDYEPSDPDLPTDPVDAVLQLVVRGEADGDELLEATKDVIFGVAVDDEGVAVVSPAPDEVPSVLATTAPRHRDRVQAPGWVEVTVEELAAALPDEGVDVLLNPGAPASMRIIADVLKEFVDEDEDTSVNEGSEGLPETMSTAELPGPEDALDQDTIAGGVPTVGAGPVATESAPATETERADTVQEPTAATTP